MKKVIPFTIVLLFFVGLCLIPPVSEIDLIQKPEKESISILSEGVSRNTRVAIYDESNTTAPAWSTNTLLSYNVTATADLLTSSGFDVTLLDTAAILNHELLTVNYDVFVMIDNVPRESIMDHVYEYWLGGGGVLSFNSAFGYLFYSGIFVPEWAGSDMYVSRWTQWSAATFVQSVNHTILARHPMGQSYHPGDLIPYVNTNTVVSNPAILATSTGSEMTVFADGYTGTSYVAWALEPGTRAGGRVIQLPGNGSVIDPGYESIIIDSVDWLAPRPKGRIVYDLSHLPRLGVDPWDTMTIWPGYMGDMRDLLEMRGYTFDKLYGKASGNLTMARLVDYDMLILLSPDFNYTTPEITTVQNWVSAGGGLLVLSEALQSGSFLEASEQINFLTDGLDLQLADVGSISSTGLFALHPLSEGCTSIFYLGNGFVNYSGNGFQVSYEDSNTIVAGNYFGDGRVILSADINFGMFGEIATPSNGNLVTNIANWLTSARADVLFYVDNMDLSNPYDAPAVDALNDLGIPFYLTYSEVYMNLSLYSQQWSLVILDSAWPGINPYLDDFSSYLDTGGDLLVSWHMMHAYSSDPLYSKIGFGYSANYPNQQPFHIWTPGHGIFNYPNNYGALNFTPGYDIGDEGDLMTVYANATALAGLTDTDQPGNATVVLGFGGHVLWNGYLIDQLTGDLDDSTYSDAFELWENEIAFMTQPTIDNPADVTYEEGTTGNSIEWTPSSYRSWSYAIERDSTTVDSGSWNGAPVSIDIDGLAVGTYVYEITVFDNVGYSTSDSVSVDVNAAPTIPTTPTTPPDGIPVDLTLLIVIAAAGVVIVIVVVVLMKKKK